MKQQEELDYKLVEECKEILDDKLISWQCLYNIIKSKIEKERKEVIEEMIEEISKEVKKYSSENSHNHNGYIASSFASELVISLNKLK